MPHRLTPLLLLACLAPLAPAAAQPPSASPMTVGDIIDRAAQAEAALIERTRELRPIVEAYIQEVGPEVEGIQMPVADTYFLGRLDWREGPTLALMADPRRAEPSAGERRGFLPDGFAAMAAPDWGSLDRDRYDFRFVRREFLGEVRTLAFDVRPKKNANDGFSGRIWIEDRDYHIVRYNGVNRNVKGPRFRKKVFLHMDGWRVNSGNGTWLPAYVHCEETGLDGQESGALVRSQVRLWGYNATTANQAQSFTAIHLDDAVINDATDQTQLTPVASQRRWEHEAEMNVVERLEQAGLLAPPGDVERVLDTVLNNLQATNDLAFERPVRARVLLTSPLESFTVGHTLVLSRGLIDVLPDEASLAMALAHELSHVVLGHRLIDTKFAFADRMMIGDAELLATIATRRDAAEEAEADAKVLEMLDRSPYADKLASAGLFLRIVAERANLIPELIQPHVGDHVSKPSDGRLADLMTRAPALDHKDLTQVPALPIGARLVVDPWDGRLELLRTAAALPGSLREKMPLAITPLTPHLTYPGSASAPARTGVTPAHADPARSSGDVRLEWLREIERPSAAAAVPQVASHAPLADFIAAPPPAAVIPVVLPAAGAPHPATWAPHVHGSVAEPEPADDACGAGSAQHGCIPR